jgi:hypothetical protein
MLLAVNSTKTPTLLAQFTAKRVGVLVEFIANNKRLYGKIDNNARR